VVVIIIGHFRDGYDVYEKLILDFLVCWEYVKEVGILIFLFFFLANITYTVFSK